MDKEVMSKEKLEELRARLEVARLKKQVKKTEAVAEKEKKEKKYTYSDGALERRKQKNLENLVKKNKDKVIEMLGETETIEKGDDSKKEAEEEKKQAEEVEQIEIKKLIEPVRSQPIDIPLRKEKFMKLVYYKEPSAKVLKKLGKIQESSSESSESEEEAKPQVQQVQSQRRNLLDSRDEKFSSVQFNENDYYRQLARKLYS